MIALSRDLIRWSDPINWSHPLNRGLVSWWLAVPGQNGFGTTRWRDMVQRSQYHGTLTNMDPATDWVGSIGRPGGFASLDFDGSNHYVSLGNVDSPNNVISVVAWVKANAGTKGFVINKDYDGSHVPYSLNVGGNASATNLDGFAFFSGSAWRNSGITTDIRGDGRWHHVTGVFDGTTLSYYLDGVLDASSTEGSGVTRGTTTTSADIGRYGAGAEYLGGQVSDLRIYSRALSASEVYQLFDASRRGYPGLLNRFFFPRVSPADAGAGDSVSVDLLNSNLLRSPLLSGLAR